MKSNQIKNESKTESPQNPQNSSDRSFDDAEAP